MEILTKPLSNEKVVRPALIYSLFPNVPPTIYFGTRNERGKPGQVSEPRRTPRRRMLVHLGGDGNRPSRMAITVPSSLPGSPVWYGNLFLICPFADHSQPHTLMLCSCPLALFLYPLNLPSCLCSSFLCIPLSSPKCAPLKLWSGTILSDLPTQGRLATVPSFSSFHHDSPALLHPLPAPHRPPFPSGETSLRAEKTAPVEDEHRDTQHCQADHWTVPLQNQQEWVTCFPGSLPSAPPDGLWIGGEP